MTKVVTVARTSIREHVYASGMQGSAEIRPRLDNTYPVRMPSTSCRGVLEGAHNSDVIGNYGNSVRDEFVSATVVIDEASTAGRSALTTCWWSAPW